MSVGFPHDGCICLWDWQRGLLVAKLKSSSSCSAIASVGFSSDGKLIVTAGKKHLKIWMVGSSTRPHTDGSTGSMAMQGKPVNLGHHKGSSFTSVSTARLSSSSVQTSELFPIYALTDVGKNFILVLIMFFVVHAFLLFVSKISSFMNHSFLLFAGVLCLLDSGLSVQKSVDLEVTLVVSPIFYLYQKFCLGLSEVPYILTY